MAVAPGDHASAKLGDEHFEHSSKHPNFLIQGTKINHVYKKQQKTR
jgi:hypothetical protein